ncbi:MAG TPA: bifunctional riboflavin kinase/FAD synthetase [Usitatibacter sp.]|jgi:riboflavin kinase/FMN adenylyltransferase|nr:bifunctional riboflavin kinase/FAD synthetase [Usitatibacter sp.]
MRILRHAAAPRDTAIAIGSFDGVHLGHAAILARVRQEAAARGLASGVVTFEPLPREFFRPRQAPPRISSLAERLADFARVGLELAFVERFDGRFAALTAAQFESRIRERYRARWVMVGEDFRYGARRAGDLASLERAGARLGFEVHAHPAVVIEGERVSSTAVREALAAGNLGHAAQLLGRPYAICGRVVHGAKRGRGMGFPTANVRLARAMPALTGIFAVKCEGAATRGLEGVASLGMNPAVARDGPATLEAFLFDFQGDLYGRRLSIEFLKKLRDEAPFASLDELVAQIRRDCDIAREFFRGRGNG